MKVKCNTCQEVIENDGSLVFVMCACGDLAIFDCGSQHTTGIQPYIEVIVNEDHEINIYADCKDYTNKE